MKRKILFFMAMGLLSSTSWGVDSEWVKKELHQAQKTGKVIESIDVEVGQVLQGSEGIVSAIENITALNFSQSAAKQEKKRDLVIHILLTGSLPEAYKKLDTKGIIGGYRMENYSRESDDRLRLVQVIKNLATAYNQSLLTTIEALKNKIVQNPFTDRQAPAVYSYAWLAINLGKNHNLDQSLNQVHQNRLSNLLLVEPRKAKALATATETITNVLRGTEKVAPRKPLTFKGQNNSGSTLKTPGTIPAQTTTRLRSNTAPHENPSTFGSPQQKKAPGKLGNLNPNMGSSIGGGASSKARPGSKISKMASSLNINLGGFTNRDEITKRYNESRKTNINCNPSDNQDRERSQKDQALDSKLMITVTKNVKSNLQNNPKPNDDPSSAAYIQWAEAMTGLKKPITTEEGVCSPWDQALTILEGIYKEESKAAGSTGDNVEKIAPRPDPDKDAAAYDQWVEKWAHVKKPLKPKSIKNGNVGEWNQYLGEVEDLERRYREQQNIKPSASSTAQSQTISNNTAQNQSKSQPSSPQAQGSKKPTGGVGFGMMINPQNQLKIMGLKKEYNNLKSDPKANAQKMEKLKQQIEELGGKVN